MESYGRDVQAVVDELDLQNIIMIGWSMGGAVMLEAARLLPERTIGLIGLDTLFPLPAPLLPEGMNSPYVKNNQDQSNLMLSLLGENPVDVLLQMVPMIISDKFDPVDKEIAISVMKETNKHSFLGEWTELLKWDFREILREINKPIKLIICEESSGVEGREGFNKYFDTPVFVKELKHWLMMEDPETINRFLEEQIQLIAQK